MSARIYETTPKLLQSILGLVLAALVAGVVFRISGENSHAGALIIEDSLGCLSLLFLWAVLFRWHYRSSRVAELQDWRKFSNKLASRLEASGWTTEINKKLPVPAPLPVVRVLPLVARSPGGESIALFSKPETGNAAFDWVEQVRKGREILLSQEGIDATAVLVMPSEIFNTMMEDVTKLAQKENAIVLPVPPSSPEARADIALMTMIALSEALEQRSAEKERLRQQENERARLRVETSRVEF